jgi:hypothetical protein
MIRDMLYLGAVLALLIVFAEKSPNNKGQYN